MTLLDDVLANFGNADYSKEFWENVNKPKIIEKDFVPERQIYYDPIIPDDLVKRKDVDGILKWAEENRNIIRSIFNVETTMKFEVKF